MIRDKMNATNQELQGHKSQKFILDDLWQSMRAHDCELADLVLETTFTFMKAQTDKGRLTIKDLGR